MNRLLAIVTIASLAAVAGCDATSSINDPSRLSGGGALTAKGGDSGNSDAAHLCQQGGWQNVMGSDGTLFRNQGDCVSFAAQGGTLVPIPTTPTITSFIFNGIANADCSVPGGPKALFTAVFSNGTGTITDPSGNVTPVTSGVQAALAYPAGGNYVLTVTNSSGSVTQTLVNPTGIPGSGVEGCPVTGLDRRPSKGPGGFSSGS